MNHRFRDRCDQVVVKLYRGDWNTQGGREYQTYHAVHFHRVPVLRLTGTIQKSINADIYRIGPDVYPHAVLEYIPGEELADLLQAGALAKARAADYLAQILAGIWVPLWAGGLRFKDCHPGNFIVGSNDRVFMIDTEQMRKDAAELLASPGTWTQRDKHEAQGLSRLPGLIARVLMACRPDYTETTAKRIAKQHLADAGLPAQLSKFGRGGDPERTVEQVKTLISEIFV